MRKEKQLLRAEEENNVIMTILFVYGKCEKISYRRMKSCFRFQPSNADEGMHLGIIRRYNLGDELRADGVCLILS